MYLSLLLTHFSFLYELREAHLNNPVRAPLPPVSDLVISSFCLHRHLNLNNCFPPFHASLLSPPFTQLPQSFTYILAADTNTSRLLFFFFDSSLCFYLIIFLGKKMVDFRVNPREGRGTIQLLC